MSGGPCALTVSSTVGDGLVVAESLGLGDAGSGPVVGAFAEGAPVVPVESDGALVDVLGRDAPAPAVVPGAVPVLGGVVVPRGLAAVGLGAAVVGLGAAVVGFGLGVVGFGAGAGAAGGTDGAAPEPNRNPTDDPGLGL